MTPGGLGVNEKIDHFEEEENPLNVSMSQKKQLAIEKKSSLKSPKVKAVKEVKDDGFKR